MIISAKTKTVLRLFHKYLGFIFSLFILQLTITGVMLLYPKFFGLDDLFVSNNYFLKKYNMLSEEDARIFGNKNYEIVLLDKSLYFKENLIDNFEDAVVNALFLKKKNRLIVFLNRKIMYYDLKLENGQYEIISVDENIFNEDILRIGRDQKGILYFKTKTNYYNSESLQMIPVDKKIKLDWFEQNKRDKNIAKNYLIIHQGKGVPLHRVITELHNGKILGSFLSYLLLLTSLSLLFLIFSSFFFGINIKRVKK